MDSDVLRLRDFLPITTNYVDVSSYIDHHYMHFCACISYGLYTSSLTHLHILYMVFVYIHIHRIAHRDRNAFSHSLIGFPGQEKEILKDPYYPLLLSIINEKTVFRFFRLNNFSESLISEISQPVNRRNDCLHANGKIICESEVELARELESYMNKMEKINAGNLNILMEDYEYFAQDGLLQDTEYELTNDDIETNILLTTSFSIEEFRHVLKERSDKVSNFIRDMYTI